MLQEFKLFSYFLQGLDRVRFGLWISWIFTNFLWQNFPAMDIVRV